MTAPCWAGPCGCGGPVVYRWQQFRDGRRQIRASCERCDRWLGFAPIREPYTGLADKVSSPTVILDALTVAQDEGVELRSDGHAVWCWPWGRASARLEQLVREKAHLLAGLIGDTQGKRA